MSKSNSDFKETWYKHIQDYGEYDPIRCGSIDGTDTEPHDRAIYRALSSKYNPNKKIPGSSKRTLFVGRLNIETNEETLKKKFGIFGKIVSCKVIRDISTGNSKRYAFIEFDSYQSTLTAHREMHQQVIDQSEIIVEFEFGRTLKGWKPRRLGGGLGGYKESGQLRFGGRARPFQKPLVTKSINYKELNRLKKSTK